MRSLLQFTIWFSREKFAEVCCSSQSGSVMRSLLQFIAVHNLVQSWEVCCSSQSGSVMKSLLQFTVWFSHKNLPQFTIWFSHENYFAVHYLVQSWEVCCSSQSRSFVRNLHQLTVSFVQFWCLLIYCQTWLHERSRLRFARAKIGWHESAQSRHCTVGFFALAATVGGTYRTL